MEAHQKHVRCPEHARSSVDSQGNDSVIKWPAHIRLLLALLQTQWRRRSLRKQGAATVTVKQGHYYRLLRVNAMRHTCRPTTMTHPPSPRSGVTRYPNRYR